MDRFPHSPDGSDRPELDDALAESLLAGEPAAVSRHPELADLLADVRIAYRRGAPPVRDPLAALVTPNTFDPAPRSTPMSLSAPRRFARFALAVVVTAIASGGLALAGALPGSLSDDPASEPTETTVDTTTPDTTTPDTTTPDTTVPEPEESEEEESEYKNHGQEVSDFARTTELEGCEKGRAISELASGKDLSHRPPCPADDDAEEGDDEDAEEEEQELESESEDGSSGGPGNRGKAPGHAKR